MPQSRVKVSKGERGKTNCVEYVGESTRSFFPLFFSFHSLPLMPRYGHQVNPWAVNEVPVISSVLGVFLVSVASQTRNV